MSGKLYTAAAAAYKRIQTQLDAAAMENLMSEDLPGYVPIDIAAMKLRLRRQEVARHVETAEMAFEFHLATLKPTTWEVGIRPKDGTPFAAFRDKVIQFSTAALWESEVVFTFEQKGTSVETLGQGFHAHIVGRSQRTKSAILKEAKRRFGAWCPEPNVRKLTRACDYIQDYFIDYKCDDHDKASTKTWDAQWRAANELLPLYGNPSAFADEV